MDAAPHPSVVETHGHRAEVGSRALFPDLRYAAYLNHAAVSPVSLPVQQAMHGAIERYATSGMGALGGDMALKERLRERFAALIGAGAGDIALLGNTTQGVAAVAEAIPWREGEKIVVFQGEFPANVTSWRMAAEREGLELVFVDLDIWHQEHAEGLEALRQALQGGVRLVCVSAVQFQTGLRMPLQDIASMAHSHGAELFVDAIQGLGCVPLDVWDMDIDYLACGGHKWLMGPPGAGFLYISPSSMERLALYGAGWLSHEDGMGFLFEGPGLLRYDRPIRRQADFLEGGMPPLISLTGAEAAIELLGQLGIPAIFDHTQRYLDALEPQLVDRGFRSLRATFAAGRSGSLCLRPPEGRDVVSMLPVLEASGISASIPDGYLRFSPHWPNQLEEVRGVIEAIDQALAQP